MRQPAAAALACRVRANSGSSERPWICAPGLPPASSISVGAMSWQMTSSLTPRARLHLARIADDERRADAFLVGEAPLGAERVLAEEIAVVAEEDDERVVELALPLQRVEDHADAFVDRRHHARALADLLLLARMRAPPERSRATRSLEARTHSAQAGFAFTTSAGGSMFGFFGKIGVAVEIAWRSAAM